MRVEGKTSQHNQGKCGDGYHCEKVLEHGALGTRDRQIEMIRDRIKGTRKQGCGWSCAPSNPKVSDKGHVMAKQSKTEPGRASAPTPQRK